MRREKSFLFLLFKKEGLSFFLLALLTGGALHGARAAAFIPANDDMVLEQLPDARDAESRDLRDKHHALAADPHNLKLALAVARGDLDRSRALADPRFLGRAEAALAPWPEGPDTPQEVRLLRAIALQSNHDFVESLRQLGEVIAARPGMAQAWLTRASIEQVQANYPAALADCGQFANLILGLAPDTCTAGIMALRGQAPRALKALSLSLAQNATEPAPTRLWALTLQAEIADRLGDPQAPSLYQAALAVDPTDPYLLGAWSDWLLDHGRAPEVASLLAGYTRADPLLLRLAEAEQALGRPEAAGHIAELRDRFEAAHLRGEVVHRREEARFTLHLLHRPAEALALAIANWGVQREPADARILAEASAAAGKPEAAAPVAAWMRDNHVQFAALAGVLK
jgi:hypothetical protein